MLIQSTPLVMEFSIQVFLSVAGEHRAFGGQLLGPSPLVKITGRKAAPALPVLIALL